MAMRKPWVCQLAGASPKETIMLRPLSLLLATAVIGSLAASTPATAGKLDNRDGCGMYSPEVPVVRGGPKVWRYDPRSWCYKPRGYYGYYGSGYWVPRAEMRYRYRYQYRGPLYTYYPAWGY
jgi:hypothetical protein